MYLDHYKLTFFKNYASQQIDCSQRLNGFTGRNGMGKTNLIDAIYYLCMGKSYFSGIDQYHVMHEEAFFRLEGHFRRDGKEEKLVIKVQPRKRKEIERNDVAYQRLSEHVGRYPVVIVVPDDTNLVSEGSEARRRFLDNTLSQLDAEYLRQLITYNQLLKQRNALLKQWGQHADADLTLLPFYNQRLVAPASYIHERRHRFTSRFRELLQEAYTHISGGQEVVDCEYRSQLNDNAYDILLQNRAEKDRVLQRTTAGVHRDDLQFTIRERPLRLYASQGQLKSFVLSLKLAQYRLLKEEKNRSPILLLDDIFDKLDAERVDHLLSYILQEEYGQIFLSDTDTARVNRLAQRFTDDYRLFTIADGQAQPLSYAK